MCPAGASAHRARTRMPVRIAAAVPASTACSRAVSAPSSRISAQANGCSSGWPSIGRAAQDHVVTVPAEPTSTSSPGGSPVCGSYSNGGTCTRPSAPRAPRMRRPASAVMNWLKVGPSDRV